MKKVDYLSTLFVGIDIGSRKNVISAIDFNQDYLIKMVQFKNSQGGGEFVEELIAKVLERHHEFKYLMIALESTGFYGVHIANYLSTCERLAPFATKVYCLNPKAVANYKKTFTDIGKNDGIDSFVIADYCRAGKVKIKPWKGSQYLALQRLTRQRLHITDCITREKTYMLNNIFLKFSEFAFVEKDEHPFSNKYGATAEAVLTEFLSPEVICDTPIEELVDFINKKSRGRFADPENTAKLLQTAARNSYRLDKVLYEPITVAISCSFNCIDAYQKELKVVENAITKAVAGLNPTEYQILRSIPGIGPVYASGILAEIGTIRCFSKNDSLAKYAGIVWRDNDSGEFHGEDTPMSKAGNNYLRYYIMEATWSVIRNCPEYQAFYDKKFDETNIHQAKRALALTSRKLIRMIFSLLDKGQLYSSDKSR